MTRQRVLDEIRRTARENSGVPLGLSRFQQATGIRKEDWLGKYWARWGDAVREAGFSPNTLTRAHDSEEMLRRLAGYARELGHIPVKAEFRLKRQQDLTFPSYDAFLRRLGSKSQIIERLLRFCEQDGMDDVAALCSVVKPPVPRNADDALHANHSFGYVYLVRHGSRREYKIGKTLNRIRREGEVALQLPEKLEPVYYIETDDPSGIEKYWHTRFADKRKEGEWFALTAEDVRAFKRWRRIY